MSAIWNRLRRASRRSTRLIELPGLDEIPWAELSHAFGPAEDVPDSLRALASSAAEERADALAELFGTIWHQGTVYQATAYAVPFLTTIATSPRIPDRESVVRLLAAIATGSGYVQVHRSLLTRSEGEEALDAAEADERDWVAAAREAVIAAATKLAGLLSDPDVSVRRSAAYALAQLPEAAPETFDRLISRLDEESDTGTLVGLVLAIATLGQAAGMGERAEAAVETATRGRPGMELAAALADVLLHEGPRADAGVQAVLASVEAGAEGLEGLPWTDLDGVVPFIAELIGDRPASRLKLAETLVMSRNKDLRWHAVGEVGDLTREWRSITPDCVRILARALDDGSEQVRRSAASELAWAYPAIAAVADSIARHAEDHDEQIAWHMIVTLARLRDPRALPVVADAVRRNDPPTWIGEALVGLAEAGASLLPDALAMVRRIPIEGTSSLDNRIRQTLAWIGALGETARPVVPELVPFLHSKSTDLAAGSALAELGPMAIAAEDDLRGVAVRGDRYLRAHAGVAIWRMAGDPRPLLHVAREVLSPPRERNSLVLSYLEELGPTAAELAPLLEELLDDPDEWQRVPGARAYWRATGDGNRVLSVLLDGAAPTPVGRLAVEALAWLGPAASGIVPTLAVWVTQDRRLRTFGTVNDAVAFDEEFRTLAQRTIAAVNSSG